MCRYARGTLDDIVLSWRHKWCRCLEFFVSAGGCPFAFVVDGDVLLVGSCGTEDAVLVDGVRFCYEGETNCRVVSDYLLLAVARGPEPFG